MMKYEARNRMRISLKDKTLTILPVSQGVSLSYVQSQVSSLEKANVS